jgi:hypothetical protein
LNNFGIESVKKTSSAPVIAPMAKASRVVAMCQPTAKDVAMTHWRWVGLVLSFAARVAQRPL